MTETPVEASADVEDVEDETLSNARSLAAIAPRLGDPRFEALFGDIAERALADGGDALSSMRALVDDLSRLIGDRDEATFFVTLLAYWNDEDYARKILDLLPDDDREPFTQDFSRLSARWGREVRVRYDLTSRDPKDWQYIDTRVQFELDRRQWTIDATVQTFDQREFTTSGPTLSFLRMVNRLLDPILQVHEVGGADPSRELDAEAVGTFLDLAGRFADLLSDSDSDEEVDPDATVDPDAPDRPGIDGTTRDT